MKYMFKVHVHYATIKLKNNAREFIYISGLYNTVLLHIYVWRKVWIRALHKQSSDCPLLAQFKDRTSGAAAAAITGFIV